MATIVSSPSEPETLADLLTRLGDVPSSRIRIPPPPGLATEQDVIRMRSSREGRLCELVDGVLVEKAMGFRESLLACALIDYLRAFVQPRNLGLVTGEQGMMRLAAGLVRIPDVAFISWERTPGGRVPGEPIPSLAPDLAVEVLSPTNTVAEMDRKRSEYFVAGTRLVWVVDAEARTVEVFDSPDHSTLLGVSDVLDGGAVLSGFTLSLRDLFAELDRQASLPEA